MEKFKSWVHVRLAFCKNIIPLTWRYFCTYFKSISYHQIILRDVLLLSHALEKGLIYNEPKPNWGIAKANSLFDKIEYLLNNNMTPTSFEIIEGLSVLEIYSIKNKQVQLSNKVLSLRKKYLIFDIYPAGRIEKTSSELFNYNDAESFIRSRRSVRFFTDRLVDENKILQAIDIANSTPSACNRQPCKVYYSIDTDTISEMGNFFLTAYRFETGIPQLLVVTSSLSLFSSDEYLQPLVNGGMFLIYCWHFIQWV